jgi:very-short-patch-repair endonuclease
MDAFVACSVTGAADAEHAVKEHLQRHKDRPVTPFDTSSYTDVIKLAAANLDSNGSYREILAKGDSIPAPGADLVVTDAWVLLSRPRTNNFLTEDLKRLKDKLVSGCDIPIGPLALVTQPSDKPVEYDAVRFRGLSSRGSIQGKTEELYFPLPYNQEQVTIIQRLEKAAGVAVQGPPGTGKTHTIANVICHYLATGRRVLVTSRGEPALEVLQSKIPDEVRSLTVALMTNDREGVRQFQASIAAIQHQVSQLNPEQTRHEIATLESAIDRAHHELNSIDKRIDEIALAQLSEVEVDGAAMRAQKLAELVVSGREQYGWFDDEISLSPAYIPPLSEEEAGKLREARRKVGLDLVYVEANCPSSDALPATNEVAQLHEVLSSMRTIEAEIASGELIPLKATTAEVLIAAQELLELVENAKTLVEGLESADSSWPHDLRRECRQPEFISERLALEALFSGMDSLVEERAEFLKRPVEFPENGFHSVETRKAVDRAAHSGEPFGRVPFGIISDLSSVLKNLLTIETSIERDITGGMTTTTTAVLSVARELLNRINEAAALVCELDSAKGASGLDLLMKCGLPLLSDTTTIETLLANIGVLMESQAEYHRSPVVFPEAGFYHENTREAVNRAAKTGKPFGFFTVGEGEAKTFVAGIKVSNLNPRSSEDWLHVQGYINLCDASKSFSNQWNQFAKAFSLPRIKDSASSLIWRHDSAPAKKAKLIYEVVRSVLPQALFDAKANISTVKVSGHPPTTTVDWSHVQRFVNLNDLLATFSSRWNQIAESLSIPRFDGTISDLRNIETISSLTKNAYRLATEYDVVLPKKAEAVFLSSPNKAFIGGSAELHKIKTQLLRHLTKVELSKAATQLCTFQEKLAGKTGPASIALKQFVEKELGNAAIPSERAAAQYTVLMAELRRIASLAVELARIKEYTVRIEQAGAPKLAARIRTEPVEMSGEDKVFPSTWRQAWTWARVQTYLDSIEARNELLGLSARRRDLEGGLSRLYREMVSKAAWLATKRNATPRVLQALAGYATAIRRIGQGTGPNATRYRRDAREAMLDAAGAVPCWIMSHARISEAMPPDIGAFDLVIVDEASQSDLWALPAILRGKKILVVGDDKQVSPDGGFIASQRIQELKDRFLSDQPFGTEMTPEKSLYDLAARVFAAEQVMLREHFRCVPSIIAYSNRVFYKGGIQPLRIPKSSERIDPPLVDIYVSDGFRDKHDHNDSEAQAIAEEISAILKNEAFAGRTIGVVSLLGMDQAKHIDTVVRQRCDAAELLRCKFQCGDARTFQGSERDIMFLSVVVDNKNCKALSGNIFDQRFNVAASRARDRMYLVRSVQLADLSDKDLRLTLFNHFNKPMVTDKEEAEVLIDLCESGFEREVFSILSTRGFRVIPQVKTGAYRIDMVVEGTGDNRLAIELDGDDYHGPDRWQHDMHRQRVLERAGWVFWRCFASTWSLRKDEVLHELLARLASMGIEPMGAMEHVPSLLEKRTWKPTQMEDGLVVDDTQAVLNFAISGT